MTASMRGCSTEVLSATVSLENFTTYSPAKDRKDLGFEYWVAPFAKNYQAVHLSAKGAHLASTLRSTWRTPCTLAGFFPPSIPMLPSLLPRLDTDPLSLSVSSTDSGAGSGLRGGDGSGGPSRRKSSSLENDEVEVLRSGAGIDPELATLGNG